MCRFKSGIILKNRVVLAPKGNESHTDLLESIGMKDTTSNALTKFVRAELLPENEDKSSPIEKWRFHVDQDVVPEWFEMDRGKYEKEFRDAVSDYMKENYTFICGMPCTAIKTDNKGTYYLLDDPITMMKFGKNNNYATSDVRKFLNTCDFLKKLKEEYGDRLIPITTDLLSLDGLDDYGKVEGDLLAIPTLDLYRECRKSIPKTNNLYWLATPDSTPSGFGSDSVRCVRSGGYVVYDWCDYEGGVRPFFILQS